MATKKSTGDQLAEIIYGGDRMRATPQSRITGPVANALRKAQQFASQYELDPRIPLLGGTGVDELLSLPEAASLMEDVSYNGPGALIRGGNVATGGLGTFRPDPRIVSAADVAATTTGVGQLGAMAARAAPGALKAAARNVSTPRTLDPQAGVIKTKGGNWLGGRLMGNMDESVKRLKPYTKAGDDGTFLQKSLDATKQRLEMLEADPYRIESMVAGQRQTIEDLNKKIALNNWVESNLGKYTKNQMATPEDPIRLLLDKRTKEIEAKHAKDLERAERVAQRAMDEPDPRRQANLIRESERLKMEANVERQFAMDSIIPSRMQDYSPEADNYLKQRRQEAGFPAEGMGESEAAKRYETLTDDAIYSMRAGDVQETKGILARAQDAERAYKNLEPEVERRFEEHIRAAGLNDNEVASLFRNTPMMDKAAIIQDVEYQNLRRASDDLSATIRRDEYAAGQQNPFIDKLDPETMLYSGNTADMGFDHVIDILKQDVMEGRIRPEQLNKVSVEDAVRRTMEFDQEAARKMAETQIKNMEGFPVYKEYPEGYRWIELSPPTYTPETLPPGFKLKQWDYKGKPVWSVIDEAGTTYNDAATSPDEALSKFAKSKEGSKALEDALKYEGDTMGHCVGGYCPDVLEGRSRIYSLRDARGEPHVTIEVGKAQGRTEYGDMQNIYNQAQQEANQANFATTGEFNNFYNDRVKELQMALIDKQQAELDPRIIQIKGKQNARPVEKYDKYTQDFVKSGKYSEVGDLENTGLFKLGDDYMTDAEAAAKYKPMTQEALNFLETNPVFEQNRAAYKAYNAYTGDVLDPAYRELERAAGEPVSKNVPYTYQELRGMLANPEDHTHRQASIYEPISRALEKLAEAKRELGIDLPPPKGMAHGGPVQISDDPDVMQLELAGGGLVKGLKAAAKAVKGTQDILPAAEREANKAKFLEGSAIKGRLYHGTHPWEKDGKQLGDVREFNRNASVDIVGRRPSIDTVGTWMSTNPGEGGAEMYGSTIYPLHAQIKNPYSTTFDQMLKRARLLGNGKDDGRRVGEEEVTALREWLKSTGYDGIQIKHNPQSMSSEFKDQDAWIALEPAQIKSAIGNRGTYNIEDPDMNKAKGGRVHISDDPDVMMLELARGGAVRMQVGGIPKKIIDAGAKLLKPKKPAVAPKGVEPIIVRTPEEQAVIDKFGQKQEQEAVRQKKVEKAARDSAGKSPEESSKPAKSTGKRVAVPPDFYRKMAEEQGDDAVLRAARAGKHLKPTTEGYIGAPRTVTSGQGLGAMRRAMDTDFADSVEAVRLADEARLGTWYDRAKQGIAESVEPYQLDRTLEQHGVYSAGVSPESELTFALKHLNSRVAGDPQMAYRGAGMRNLDKAVAENRPANMGFKIGEYANKNDPRIPNTGLFGVNDFRRAQGMGYTDPQGNPWKAGVSDTMHPFMDAETALQVDRANAAGTGGRTDWQGPHIQEVPWVYGKAQDLYSRGKRGQYKGDELEGIKQSLVDANNTARDYMYKHAASATHEQVPGAGLNHVPQVLSMTPEQKLAYGLEGRFDMPSPEMALNEFPQVGAGNRDAIYGALGYRQLPSREAQGLYTNSLGEVETNPMTIARPLMDFPTGGGGGRISEESSKVMDAAEQFRALMDAQEAGAYNLPNTMDSVQGKNAMVLDTRGLSLDPLLDPSAGVTPTSKQLSEINRILGEASKSAGADANKLRGEMPYGPPTKSVLNKLGALDEAAGGYGVTSTNRGALVFPYNSKSGTGGLNEIMKRAGEGLEIAMPGAQRQKGVASTGYVPGVGKRGEYGPLPTAPYSGEATSDMLRAFADLPPTVSQNLGESEAVREAIRAKALRDSKLGGTRGDIQETRRFFSEADWPKAVALMRKGMTPAAALAALGYNINAMAADDR